MKPAELLFSHAGNINRRTYGLSLLALFWGPPIVASIFPPAVLLLLPAAYAFLCLTVKRLHDIGLSGKWALLPLVAVAVYVLTLLLSGVIAFGAGRQNAGADAQAWAGAVGGWLALCVFLCWGALIVMPGNRHARQRFGRPAAPLIAPPVPNLKAASDRLRGAAPDARKIILRGKQTAMEAASAIGRVSYLRLFFAASGRISRGAYIAACLVAIFVFMLIIVQLGGVPVLNWATGLAFIYCMTCLASKRLHDFGASGWLAGMPFAVIYAYIVFVFVAYLMSLGFFGPEIRSHPLILAFKRSEGDWTGAVLLGSLLAYAIIGLIPGQRGPNRHGDAPSLPAEEVDPELVPA